MNIRLITGIAITITLGVMAATVKAEADSITAPANGLAAHDCSIVEEFKDGTQVIQTKKGLLIKFLPNGLVIRKSGKLAKPAVHAGALSSLINLSK